MKSLLLATATLLAVATSASASEPIVGRWKSPDGGVVRVVPCGPAYCATVIKGHHRGRHVARLKGTGEHYTGTVTDPRNDRQYEGQANIDGRKMRLKGCALKVLCKTQTWTRL